MAISYDLVIFFIIKGAFYSPTGFRTAPIDPIKFNRLNIIEAKLFIICDNESK